MGTTISIQCTCPIDGQASIAGDFIQFIYEDCLTANKSTLAQNARDPPTHRGVHCFCHPIQSMLHGHNSSTTRSFPLPILSLPFPAGLYKRYLLSPVIPTSHPTQSRVLLILEMLIIPYNLRWSMSRGYLAPLREYTALCPAPFAPCQWHNLSINRHSNINNKHTVCHTSMPINCYSTDNNEQRSAILPHRQVLIISSILNLQPCYTILHWSSPRLNPILICSIQF